MKRVEVALVVIIIQIRMIGLSSTLMLRSIRSGAQLELAVSKLAKRGFSSPVASSTSSSSSSTSDAYSLGLQLLHWMMGVSYDFNIYIFPTFLNENPNFFHTQGSMAACVGT